MYSKCYILNTQTHTHISWISMSVSAKSMPSNDCEVQETLNLWNIYEKPHHVHSGSQLWLQHMVCKWKQVWENRWSCQAQQGLEFTVGKQCDKTPPSAWQETCWFEDRAWKMLTGVNTLKSTWRDGVPWLQSRIWMWGKRVVLFPTGSEWIQV